jgi:uncharacterized protein (DUF885 family)
MFIRTIGIAFLISAATGHGENTVLNEVAGEVMQTIWQFHPVDASYLGLAAYDTLLANYSKKALGDMAAQCHALNEKLEQIDTAALSVDEQIDLRLLKIQVTAELFALERTKEYEKNPLVYGNECVYGVYTILRRRMSDVTMHAIKKRLDQMPDFLNTAMATLRNPPSILCDITVEQLSEGTKLIEDFFAEHKAMIAEDERRAFQMSVNRAIAALERFTLWLNKSKDGAASAAIGKDNYEYKLRNIHLIDLTSDGLLTIGYKYLDSLNVLIDSLERSHHNPPSKRVTVPNNFGMRDVIAYQNEEIAAVRDFVKSHNLVTIPEWIGSIEIVETPSFLRGVIPGVAMVPPAPYDTSPTSLFYIPPIPDQFDHEATEYYYNYIQNHWFRRSVIHEAYPGHHLQLSRARCYPSDIRKGFGDYFFIEGWALYCEELMARSGLYEDSVGALIDMLYGLRFRAGRVIVDVKLQTGAFTFEEAVDFMTTEVRSDRNVVTKEVRRYITTPGQPSSYLIGELQILQLLDDYRAARGEAFELKEFHDDLLSHGSIPISLMRRCMLPQHNRGAR